MSSRMTDKQRNLIFLVWCASKYEKKRGISTARLGRMAGYESSGGLYPFLQSSNFFKEHQGIWSLTESGESYLRQSVLPLSELNRKYISFLLFFFSSFLFIQWFLLIYFKVFLFTSGAIFGVLISPFLYLCYYRVVWYFLKFRRIFRV